MNIGASLHGFRVTQRRPLPEIEAVMWRMVHEKIGTELVYFERADENKTFAIAFTTVPEDSTGVFHILEHSVLCGSEKYPVKEPFVELLKGSLQTFLNAMTYPDKTVYPVASKNGRDFLNLVDVYMDAVLYPAILKDADVFRQEGWHFEFDESGEPAFSGVVYNEMKGAYSSVDEITGEYLTRLVYKNSPYAYDSGGDPAVIPELTYEKFLATHKKFYHPSGAHIFLDGEIDLDATLGLLDGYLSRYERQEPTVKIEIPDLAQDEEMTVRYEISEQEDTEGKARLALAFPAFSFDDRREILAASVLFDILAGSNEAPLKAAVMNAGLAEDLLLYTYDDVLKPAVFLEVVNAKEENLPKIEKLIFKTLEKCAADGFDAEEIEGSLSTVEFRMRERDFGSYPRGIVYALAALGSWNYGGDPALSFETEEDIAALRAAKTTDYYTNLLKKLLLSHGKRAKLVLLPSKTLADERAEAEAKRARVRLAGLGENAASEQKQVTDRLHEKQSTPDGEEALSTLPSLSLSDIEKTLRKTPTEEYEVDGVRVIYHPLPTSGIEYGEYRFNFSDIAEDEVPYFSLFLSVLSSLPTEKYSIRALQSKLRLYLGNVAFSSEIYDREGGAVTLYWKVTASLLESKRKEARELLTEILYHTNYDAKDEIRALVKQMKIEMETSMTAAGHAAAISRVDAFLSASGALVEKMTGYDFYRFLTDFDANFEERVGTFSAKCREFVNRGLRRERLILAVTGNAGEDDFAAMAAPFQRGGVCPNPNFAFSALGKRREAIVTPAQVSFAVMAAKLDKVRSGAYLVAKNILTYEFLWNRVRVQGGAYGTGFGCRRSGLIFFYSYRDPNGAKSLDVYGEAAGFLREFANSDADFDKYVIGAIASTYPLQTPRTEGACATAVLLRGDSYEDLCREREEILTADRAALLAVADELDELFRAPVVSVVGGKSRIDALGDKVDTVLKL